MRNHFRVAALIAVCLASGAAIGAHWAGRQVEVEEDPGAVFPEESAVPLDLSRPTLVLFVHPGSPGAEPALNEVARLQKKFGGRVAVSVRVYRRPGAIAGWEKMPVWKKASEISADVAADPTGDVARKFGVSPAETAVVYAPSGRLMFRGPLVARTGRGAAAKALSHLTRLLEAWRRLESRPVIGVAAGQKT